MFESQFKQERKEKLEEMFERAELKVQFVKSLHDFVLQLDNINTPEIDSGEFELTLKEKFNSHIESDERLKDVLVKIETAKTLRAELKTEKEQISNLPDEERTDEVIEKFRSFSEERKIKIDEIDNDPEVSYLKQVLDYIEYLVDLKKDRDRFKEFYDEDGGKLLKDGKFAHAISEFFNNKYKEHRERIKKIYPNYKGYNLGKANYGNYLKDVVFKGLGVIVVFNEHARGRLRSFNDVGGMHFENSSISYSFNDKEKESVIEHEYSHTLYGQHKSHRTLYSERFLGKIKSIVSPTPESILMQLLRNEENSKENDLKKNILGYQKQLMGEIFADIGSIFDHKLAYGFYKHFNTSMEELDKYADTLEDEQLKSVIKNAQTELKNSLNRYMAELSELVYLANKLNMVDDAIAGMLVFEGDARKALRHFKGIIGEERVATIMVEYNPEENRIHEAPTEIEDGNEA